MEQITTANANGDEHCGIVAVVGAANVGKSTTINRIFGEKVSIASAVPQTTRNVVRGILGDARGQLVFLDTPGVHKAKTELNRLMNAMARKAVDGTDAVLLVLDQSQSPKQEDEGWMRKIAGFAIPAIFLLNKSDCEKTFAAKYKELWETVKDEKAEDCTVKMEWMEGAAKTGTGIDKLVARLFELTPVGPRLFDDDVLTDFPRNWTIADVIREKFFHLLHKELPHSLAVEVQQVETTDNGGWTVRADVLVERHPQKGIVLGKKGRMLKHVIGEAERDLKEMYGFKVKLELWVKVEPNWQRNHWILKRLGYRS